MLSSYYAGLQPSVHALNNGQCIAYPTEGVWGVGCDPFNHHAVTRVLQLKRRIPEKGLILIAGDIKQFDFLLQDLAIEQYQRLQQSWPSHTTWLVPHNHRVSPLISGDSNCVAIRVSKHPLIRQLAHAFGGPIVSTSANPAGKPAALTSLKARCYFKRQSLVFTPGVTLGLRTSSRIIDLHSGKVLRA